MDVELVRPAISAGLSLTQRDWVQGYVHNAIFPDSP